MEGNWVVPFRYVVVHCYKLSIQVFWTWAKRKFARMFVAALFLMVNYMRPAMGAS